MRFSIEIHLDDPGQLADAVDVLRDWISAKNGNPPSVFRSDLRRTAEGKPIVGRIEFRKGASEELLLTDGDRKLLAEMQIAEGGQP